MRPERLAQQRLYTIKETAEFFSMSISWVRERIKKGELDGFLCGNLLVSGGSINRYLASRAVGPQIAAKAAAEPKSVDTMAAVRAARKPRLTGRPIPGATPIPTASAK